MKNHLVLLLISATVVLIFGAFAALTLIRPEPIIKKPPVVQKSNGFDQNYSNFNYIKPGQSTLEEIVKLNGKPVSSKAVGDETILLYPTPNSTFNNIVSLRGGKVFYAMEYVFGDYRGSYEDNKKKLGNPELTLYSDSGLSFYVFLSKGLAFESSNNEITRIIYFIPQNEDAFMKEIGEKLGLTKEQPSPEPQENIY